ncbi:MAG: RHS repeat protein [Opitutaceae bacterium]|jgi:YD repeat-containing protein|nr:RHS repeat protein [Opitutaceae bacterium]
MDDPDTGTWTYAYNALGELLAQTEAKNQTTTLAYDALGRLTARTDADSNSNGEAPKFGLSSRWITRETPSAGLQSTCTWANLIPCAPEYPAIEMKSHENNQQFSD